MCSSDLLVRSGGFGGSFHSWDGFDDGLQVGQHIPLWRDGLRLRAFIIEAVTSIHQLARLHPSVGTTRCHRSTCIEEFATDTSEVIAFLLSGCPA